MSKRPLPRLAALALVSLFFFAAAAPRPSPAADTPSDGLVVHEWGTFTSVSGPDGQALVWRPLSVESDLPPFVYSIDERRSWQSLRYPSKSGGAYTVRMETPVLYFYAEREQTVSVGVNFPQGKITEWYPQATNVVGVTYVGGAVRWEQFKVLPGARAELRHDGTRNHYYPARATDAATLRVGVGEKTEHEKFLFYRGVGDFPLPLSAKLSGSRVVVANLYGEGVGKVILFENRGGRLGYTLRQASSGETELPRPALDMQPDGLRRELKAMLVAGGLYEREADAMLDTWRDSWFEEGLRVFYLMPRKTTDSILPIRVEPAPTELVRVLVGRQELISPEMERSVAEQVARLGDGAPESERAAAMREITRYGRFTETVLRQVRDHAADQRLRARVERLLAEMARGAPRLE